MTLEYFNEFCRHISKEITGVIHVGAHQCEERETYLELFRQTDDSILWIDPLQEIVEEMKDKHPTVKIIQACCSDKAETQSFYVSNYSQCAGLLPFSEAHKETFKQIEQVAIPIEMTTLDSLIPKKDKPLRNMLVISVNGAEMKVLKGAETLLEFIDFVVVRFEKMNFHDRTPAPHELKDWLGVNGFTFACAVDVSKHSEACLFTSQDAEYETAKRQEEQTYILQQMISEYNEKNNTNITTQVYSDLDK